MRKISWSRTSARFPASPRSTSSDSRSRRSASRSIRRSSPPWASASRICAASIANVTTDSPKGSIDGATRTFTIYDNDQLLAAQPWNDAIIAYKNGAPVRVRDIGQAVEGPERSKLAGWSNDKRAIILCGP